MNWTLENDRSLPVITAAKHFAAKKFVGYVMATDGKVGGAIFCPEKVWWNNSELFIDEMFVRPDLQRRGYGSALLRTAESYIEAHDLAGFTLSTNRYAPAP